MTERRVKMSFICTGNSARSQMAEGLTRAMSDGQVECYSAGTGPKPIHPLAIRAMAEVGLDISKNVSKGLAQFLDEDFDYVISVCARAAETCPTWPRSREQIRWHFDDPAEAAAPEEDRLRVFRRVRNEIQQRLADDAGRQDSHEAAEGEQGMNRVIFACVHNAGRSQMAAAFFNTMADPQKAHAVSAGTHPGDRVHPEVVTVMREAGIDLANARPQRLTAELAKGTHTLVTMGCGDECPVVPGAKRDDWPLTDPKGKPIEEVRRIRDEIRERVGKMISAEEWKRAG